MKITIYQSVKIYWSAEPLEMYVYLQEYSRRCTILLYCHTSITVFYCGGGVILHSTNFKSVVYELLLTKNTTHTLNHFQATEHAKTSRLIPTRLYKLYSKYTEYHTIHYHNKSTYSSL